jgi:hypothetical protein
MKLFSQYDRFELEQDIIKAWGVVEELEELVRQHLDRPQSGFSEDELANRLDAIKYMADMRFQRLWDGFEVMLKNGQFAKIGEAVPVDDLDILIKKGKKKK